MTHEEHMARLQKNLDDLLKMNAEHRKLIKQLKEQLAKFAWKILTGPRVTDFAGSTEAPELEVTKEYVEICLTEPQFKALELVYQNINIADEVEAPSVTAQDINDLLGKGLVYVYEALANNKKRILLTDRGEQVIKMLLKGKTQSDETGFKQSNTN